MPAPIQAGLLARRRQPRRGAAGPGCPALATHPLRPQPSSSNAHNSEKMQKVATLEDFAIRSLLVWFLHFEEIEDVYCQCGAWRYACTDSRRMPRGGGRPLWPLTLAGRPMRARGRVGSLFLPSGLLLPPPPHPPSAASNLQTEMLPNGIAPISIKRNFIGKFDI